MSRENITSSSASDCVDHDERKKRTLEQIFPLGTGFDFSDQQDSSATRNNTNSSCGGTNKSARKSSLPRKSSLFTEDFIEIEDNPALEEVDNKVLNTSSSNTSMALTVDTKEITPYDISSPQPNISSLSSPRKRFQASIDLPEVG